MSIRVSWSDLPEEILTKIGECLGTRFNVTRFRSVCGRWRYSLPTKPRLQFPLPLPFPHSEPTPEDLYSSLVRTTVYILNQYPTPSPIPMPWFLKLEETQEGKFRIINPISNSPIKDLATTFPKVFNSLHYSTLEVSRGFICRDTKKPTAVMRHSRRIGLPIFVTTHVRKAVMLPESDSMGNHIDDFMVLTLCPDGGLLLWRNGDDRWKQINEDESHYDDIAVYRGRFVAIDRWGTVSLIDPSLQLIRYTPPIVNGGSKKHLVVSSDDLYAVDRYLDRARTTQNPYEKENAKVVAFKVYKFDEDWGWREVQSLEDRMLFIGEESNFFVPIEEHSGCKGNCIYFIDEKRTWYNDEDNALIGSTGQGCAVFDLADQRIGKLLSFSGYSEMFWPPPSWFIEN
ncbi:hypothetical protein PTKIN_Ptkin07bG0310100 [Pterospermum kingtungense]